MSSSCSSSRFPGSSLSLPELLRDSESQVGQGGSCPGPPSSRPAPLTRLPPSLLLQSEITHDELCATCKRGANLQPCGTCPGAYHLSCLDPPLKTAPKGVWRCPKCQQKVWEAVLPGSGPSRPHPLSLHRRTLYRHSI